MTNVRIVSDSTCDLPAEYVQRHGITVVPCIVNLGARSVRDIVDISREEFYRAMPEMADVPHTSGPPVGAFAEAFANAGRDGAEVVSLHPPAALSGIFNTARVAAENAGLPPGRVHVIDAGQLSMGLGWLAIMAAELAEQGRTAIQILEQLARLRARTYVYAALDTLRYLRHSGRVNWAQASLGSLLQIKLLVELHAGNLVSFDRVRTRARSLERLVEGLRALGPLDRLAIMHTHALEAAAALQHSLAGLAAFSDVPIVEATPAIGTHIGPRAVGFAAVKSGD
jgi:DegV family protein with EDD domain